MDTATAPAHDQQKRQSTPPEPLLVRPAAAMILLSCGRAKLYELINGGELESYKEGKSRKITTASIKAYIARKLAEAMAA